MENTNNTYKQLTYAALELFLERGVKKTTVDDISVQAGLTRNTAYRYFNNKKSLVRAAFMEVLEVFQRVEQSLSNHEFNEIENALDAIQAGMAELPKGNFLSLLDQLRYFDPKIYTEVHAARVDVVKRIFDHLSKLGEQQGRMRKDLNGDIARIFFTEIVINLISSPRLTALNLSPEEVYANIKSIFLRGILK